MDAQGDRAAQGDMADDEKAFAGIEICRFLCALAVVVYHYQHFFANGV